MNCSTLILALFRVCFLLLPAMAAVAQPAGFPFTQSQQKELTAANPDAIPVYHNGTLTIAHVQPGTAGSRVVVSSYKKQAGGFVLSWTVPLPNSLDKLGGFTSDGTNYYCLTTKNENLITDPSANTHRNGVVRLVKLNASGAEVWTREINQAAYLPEPVYSPLDWGTGGLAYGNGFVTMVFSKNTGWDANISSRHQTAAYLTVDAATGRAARPGDEMSWRHSFDQRVIFDGKDFVVMDLGDKGFLPAAGISVRKVQVDKGQVHMPEPDYYWSHGAFVYVRQGNGANGTFTTLGDMVAGEYGYTVLFASEVNNTHGERERDEWSEPVREPRNLGLVHVVKNFESVMDGRDGDNPVVTNMQRKNGREEIFVSENMVDTRQGNEYVTESYTFRDPSNPANRATQSGLLWLTHHTGNENFTSVERPKLVAIAPDQYMAVWEEWLFDQPVNPNPEYQATWALLVDAYGNVLSDIAHVNARLNPSGADRPFVLDGKAAWITRARSANAASTRAPLFFLHTLDGNLSLESLPLSGQ